MTNADPVVQNTTYSDLDSASEALEACLSEFFKNNLKAEQTTDAGTISGLFIRPVESQVRAARL